MFTGNAAFEQSPREFAAALAAAAKAASVNNRQHFMHANQVYRAQLADYVAKSKQHAAEHANKTKAELAAISSLGEKGCITLAPLYQPRRRRQHSSRPAPVSADASTGGRYSGSSE